MERNGESRPHDSEPPTPHSLMKMGSRDRGNMEDPDGTLASVAQCIEQLRQSSSSSQEKEKCLRQLLELINTRENAFGAVGSHSQAVPVLVSLLRSGSLGIKIQSAVVLGSLCQENELRVKVLLGGCIPPLLGLLKSNSREGQIAAAKTIYSVSQGGAKDHVGSKIFSTEGVVPALWQQLDKGLKAGNEVDHLLTGALRNLCSSTEGFWPATIQAGGVDVLVKLLTTGQSSTQANVCFLLASMMMEDASICSKILAAEATKLLLKLLGPDNEAPLRAEAASALKSLSAQSKEARREIANANGIPVLINATIAPSKEFMQGEFALALQDNAMCALANISGGLSYVISSLGQSLESCSSPAQVADTLGALASALMIYDSKAEYARASDPEEVEKTLLQQLKPQLPFLIQERTIEALASLYGNGILASKLANSDAKRLLVGLITMATDEVQEELIRSLLIFCNNEGTLWQALQGREGIQLLISLLGLSSEQQQECAVALLCLLSNENDDSKWAITAAGGIPPLVQILETGSAKAKEDSATILGNLCNHSEDIRACVESADAVPALLWLLKNGRPNGKEIAAKTLNHLIHKSDTATISQLTALLLSDLPESKIYVLDALKSLLCVAPLSDMVREGSAANDAIETMIKILSSVKEETQARSALALAGIFDVRKDLRETNIAVKTLGSVMKLLSSESETILAEVSQCLAAIFLSVKENRDLAALARDALPTLVVLANSSVLQVAEQAVCALANLLLDYDTSEKAISEEIVLPATAVLREGSNAGKIHAAAAIARLLRSRQIDSSLTECVNRNGTVLAIVSFLETADSGSVATSEALDALAFLSRSTGYGEQVKPAWAVLAEYPSGITQIVSCIADATPLLQDKAIEILSRLAQARPLILGNTIACANGCISSITRRVISSSDARIKIGGAALLICTAKVKYQQVVEDLHGSNMSTPLIHSLVGMLASSESSPGADRGRKDIISISRITEKESEDDFEKSTSVISGVNIVTWLLSILASRDDKSKVEIMEAGAIEVLTDKISESYSHNMLNDYKEDGSIWICALLLAILFQDRDIIRANATMKVIPVLASLFRTEEGVNRYFAAQAVASLVCNGSRGTLLSVANSGAPAGLISLLGCADADIHDLLELADDFALVRYPDQVALERLFRVDDIRLGATSRKAIPALVDLLKPIPERPGAPFLALGLLIQLATDCPTNQIAMVDTAEIRRHESAFGAVSQLVARSSFGVQAVQPLVEILSTGLEKEQHAAIAALIRLLNENPSKALAVADVEMNAVDVLCRILSSNYSMELKGDAAELCSVLFGNTRIRSALAAARCVEPLVSLLVSEYSPSHHSVVRALDKLLDDDQLAELVAAHGAVIPLVGLLYGRNYLLHEAISRALVKLGKDRPACKMEMVKAGVIECVLDILHEAPDFLSAAFSELLRILTNNASIAKGHSAAKVVEPLFQLLTRSEFGPDGQHSALQVLVNILEHPQCRVDYTLTSQQAIEPLLPLLDSPASAVRQLAAELLSHLLLEEHLQKDPLTQQRAVRALVNVSTIWPNEIAKEGVGQLSSVILQSDPLLPHALWECAASVLSSILQYSSEFYLEVPVAVLVRLLRSGTESTVVWCSECPLVFRAFIMQDRDLSEYNPSGSSTSKIISCSHQLCALGPDCPNPKQQCPYTINYYSDDTSTSGFLVEDVLHLLPGNSDVSNKSVKAPVVIGCVLLCSYLNAPDNYHKETFSPFLDSYTFFYFRCGNKQTGGYLSGVAPDGLLGLDLEKFLLGVFLQKLDTLEIHFLYVLTKMILEGYFLGTRELLANKLLLFCLCMGKSNLTYIVGVDACCIESSCLENPEFQMLVDSGSSFSFLPAQIFEKVANEFDRQVNAPKSSFEGYPWKYCYKSSPDGVPKLPSFTLKFATSKSFVVKNPVFVIYGTQGAVGFCLAVQAADGDIGTIGQNFMTGYQIVFDRENFKLGWSESNCKDLSDRAPLNPTGNNSSSNSLPTAQQQSAPNSRAVSPAVAGKTPSESSAKCLSCLAKLFSLMLIAHLS
ncbi:hypothetical protein SASPL_143639 [Salvia splendens]|uniref:Peptidase A1 domain-containing protein n=1 Tax=Salvia splendens TaxID=180675 RepID=A0A8X8ZAJ2_SALSN|nr:hypothetical protein SASPL_143639 [Salvia splendens]